MWRLRLAGTVLFVAMRPALALPAVAQAGLTRPAAGSVRGPFVALGDSFAAGNLIPASPSGTSPGCLRSSHDYGADAAAALRAARFVDATCTGASTTSMTQPEPVLPGTNPPQFSVLAADDSVVTLTLGGDDVGFPHILATCAALSLTDLSGGPCQRHHTAGGTDRLAAAITATAPKIAAVLRGIHLRAPSARVLLVGYPDILLATGDGPYLRAVETRSPARDRPGGGPFREHVAEWAGARPVLCYPRRVNITELVIFHRPGGSSPPSDTKTRAQLPPVRGGSHDCPGLLPPSSPPPGPAASGRTSPAWAVRCRWPARR